MQEEGPSEFRVEKHRVHAVLALSRGGAAAGCFFVAGGSPAHPGPERLADLLNGDSGFFPFEMSEGAGTATVLLHRDHLVTVTLDDNEASRDPAYGYAISRRVSLLLTSGERLTGDVRVYRPAGRDRLSDWARHGERFRYVETSQSTVIVNVDHIIEAREVP